MEVTIIRESTKETRAAILKSAMEVFLEVGYQEASMRKIAARAGITAGAIYKHFSGKEEMFDEIFEESGRKLMEVTESMIGIDFTAMSDDELLNVLYSRISVHIFDMLEAVANKNIWLTVCVEHTASTSCGITIFLSLQ